jgi:tetratricopeptide (TPR) repeat protein
MSLHNLAGALSRLADLYSAEAIMDESLCTERGVLGNNHPDLGYPLNLLGVVALKEGDWRKAEPLLRESLRIWSRLGPNHTVTGLTNWGRVLPAEGSYAEARRYFERVLALAEHQTDATYYTAWVSARFHGVRCGRLPGGRRVGATGGVHSAFHRQRRDGARYRTDNGYAC